MVGSWRSSMASIIIHRRPDSMSSLLYWTCTCLLIGHIQICRLHFSGSLCFACLPRIRHRDPRRFRCFRLGHERENLTKILLSKAELTIVEIKRVRGKKRYLRDQHWTSMIVPHPLISTVPRNFAVFKHCNHCRLYPQTPTPAFENVPCAYGKFLGE
jgi:hypothetical protein